PGRVPEELRFLRIARQRAALHGDEGAFGARARIVERSRGELLAGARFARDEDAGIRGRGLADQLEHAPDAGALADDRPGTVGALQVALQDGVLARDAALVQRPRDGVQELVVVERLDEVVDGPGAQRADGALHGRVAGDHDDRQRGMHAADFADRIEAGAVWQLQVGDDEVDPGRAAARDPRLERAGALHAIAFPAEQQLDHLRQARVIVDQEHARPHQAAPSQRGRSSSKQAPPCGWLYARIA